MNATSRRCILVSSIVAACFLAVQARAATVVTPSDLDIWSYDSIQTGTTVFADGPGTPPLGSGSVNMSSGSGSGGYNGGKSYVFTSALDGVKLADITTLSYSTYVDTASGSGTGLVPYINLHVDFDNNGSFDSIIVWDSYDAGQGSGVKGSWQDWDALTGKWWSVSSFGSIVSGQTLANKKTISEYYGLYPDAKIIDHVTETVFGDPIQDVPPYGLTLVSGQHSGGSWINFIGAVDNVSIGVLGNTTTYDFEADPPSVLISDTFTNNQSLGSLGYAVSYGANGIAEIVLDPFDTASGNGVLRLFDSVGDDKVSVTKTIEADVVFHASFDYRFTTDGQIDVILGGETLATIISPASGPGRDSYTTFDESFLLSAFSLTPGFLDFTLALSNVGDPEVLLDNVFAQNGFSGIPEPGTLLLGAFGGLMLLVWQRKRSNQRSV